MWNFNPKLLFDKAVDLDKKILDKIEKKLMMEIPDVAGVIQVL